ncbi:MAG: beta galactosidase jelly roll domain-containing protein [Prevotellaceae bacterium]|jgi:sialate O-acetylesterase|nr:beta galactosidase jelly roll domain-containing protein [Prevotellaceae bacterium]
MKKFGLLIMVLCLLNAVQAKVKVPEYVSDNMMVQRDAPVKIWGWANKGETVIVSLNGQIQKAKTGTTGVWQVSLNAVPVGGPYEMTIKGKDSEIVVKNILSGDIWVCSGQSNMEMSIDGSRGKVKNSDAEIAASDYPKIRLLTVVRNKSHIPLQDTKMSGWQECSPKVNAEFSAVAYFFGREIHKQTGIPVGLINTSWGGTNVETWTSLPVMKTLPEYRQKTEAMELPEFAGRMSIGNVLAKDPGFVEEWYKDGKKIKNAEKTNVPQQFNHQGIFWYRKEFVLTAEQAKNPITLHLGAIDDHDLTYLNGKKIGETNKWDAEREYKVETGMKQGVNELMVCVVNPVGAGGFVSETNKIFCATSSGNIPLAGEWFYCRTSDIGKEVGPNDYPSLLYNAMIAPLISYPVKGFIWYQGESNAGMAYRYRTLFKNLINDWRSAWKQGDLPFYFVQLAAFMQPVAEPGEDAWAELREAQHLTLSLPNTGEAIAIDIGEANDIHPRNKQDVGYRLALNALAKDYGKKIEYSGPEYVSMKIDGNRIVLTFKHTADGLTVRNKYGYLQGFTIAGADKKFVWAPAYIEGNTVVVSSDKVKSPVAVRYAWAINPDDANLYNSAGLPASPFRTDDWEISTQKK